MTLEHIKEAVRVTKKTVVAKCDKEGMRRLVEHGFTVMKESVKKSFYYVGIVKDV